MKSHRVPALLLCGALLVSLSACGGGEAQNSPAESEPPAGTAVQVETVNANTISTENKISGKVESDTDASVFVATAAKCTAVYVEVGDTVRAGQAICTLDLDSTLSSAAAADISYSSAVQSYQDQKAVFDAQIALAEKNVRDLKALYEIGAASQIEIDHAEIQLQTATATRNATLAQLEAGMQSAKSSVEQLDTALENVDGNGNRVAAMAYGPKNVLVVAGVNKIVKTAEDALVRARTVASPINAQRFGLKTPCSVTGACSNCDSPDCICNVIVTTRHSKPAGRIKVLLVGEILGF